MGKENDIAAEEGRVRHGKVEELKMVVGRE